MNPGQMAGMETHEQLWFLFLDKMGLHGSLDSHVLRHEAVPGVCLAPVCLWTQSLLIFPVSYLIWFHYPDFYIL